MIDVALPDPVFQGFAPDGEIVELYHDDPSVEFMSGVADIHGPRSKRSVAMVWIRTGTVLTRWEAGAALNMDDCYEPIPVSLLMLRRSADDPTSVNLVAEVTCLHSRAMRRFGTHVHRCMSWWDMLFTTGRREVGETISHSPQMNLTVAPGKVLLMFGLVREGVVRIVELGSTVAATRHVADLDPRFQQARFQHPERRD